MNPRERPGKRGLVFPPSYYRDQYTPAQEAEHERLQEAEGERAPADRPKALDELPEYAQPRGEACGHRLWYIGLTSDAMPIELCDRCGQSFIGVVIEDPCPNPRWGAEAA